MDKVEFFPNRKMSKDKELTNLMIVASSDKKGNPVVGKDAEATGTNAADGSITFAPVSYDTDRLMADVKAGIASVDKSLRLRHMSTHMTIR